MSYRERLIALRALLARHRGRGLAIAFSGGVDSSVLLHAATAVLGERAVGIVADSPSLERAELEGARAVARDMGARLVAIETSELEREGYRRNDGLRCYWCRATLFGEMRRWADANGFAALAYGEITDDLADVRPGRLAAGEARVSSPLLEAGFDKRDVRRYAREHGLAVADKPSGACLASRLPIGTEVTATRLRRIEHAEAALAPFEFRTLRVRDRGRSARVEVGAGDVERAKAARRQLAASLAPYGFDEVSVAPYRTPGR